ncbi:uncharacterized protein LY89DRAFT_252084 [Mollisia scopiformis]|uniref:Uncharacterized protein n=1 Tax=Mollisia scopiformis TaxID=149040 RepID=A0A194WTG8_MOLSC|nr:uncharacterized protein LY89DRAFT_252084 [Mollisia scopiformis]KUJ10907.1 hypothetical protein LY89DRAFT_252084 [Mollisia scopiformis]
MSIPPPLPLTEFARKYGQYATYHRSGFTPHDTKFPYFGPDPLSGAWDARALQKEQFYGFTSEELGYLDCLPTRELKLSTLNNGIMSTLRRDNWENTPSPEYRRSYMYALEDGNGLWSAANDFVWNSLQPSLILASRILMSVHLMPWFDALIDGPREPIDPNVRLDRDDLAKPNARFLESFRPKDTFNPAITNTDMRDRMFALLENVFELQIGFMDPNESPTTGLAPGEKASGMCTVKHKDNLDWKIFIWLDIDMLKPLLRTDINSADRMMIDWQVANTIAHELMHALNSTKNIYEYDEEESMEPFFREEPISEVGNSFESAINFGFTVEFNLRKQMLPLGFWHRRNWPTVDDIRRTNDPFILTNPGPAMDDEYYPIPVQAWEDMQQEGFWDILVRKFGHGVLHYRQVREGAKITYTVKDKKRKLYDQNLGGRIQGLFSVQNQQYKSNFQAIQSAASMTPDERAALQFAWSLIASSEAEQEFWDNSTKQQTAVDFLIGSVNALMVNQFQPAQIQTIASSFLGLVRTAISNHEVMIAAIKSAEAANNTTYPNRRRTLLIWNRGTRTFMNRVLASRLLAAAGLNWTQQFLDLEACRMHLWDPNIPGDGIPEDRFELENLSTASGFCDAGQASACLATCNGIRADASNSIIANITCKVLLFDAYRNVFNLWPSRKTDLHQALEMLGYFAWAAPAPWQAYLGRLKTKGEQLYVLPQPPQPGVPPPPPPPPPPVV